MHAGSRVHHEPLFSSSFIVDAAGIIHTSVIEKNAAFSFFLTWKEEATEYVRDSDSFVTVMLLENTPAVLSLGKLCEDDGYN